MKVFVKPQAGLSRAMDRVARALVISTPAVEEVDLEEDADFVLIHAIGFPETVEAVERCKARGQKVAIAQYCLRTTQKPNVADWLPLWQSVDLVWSYYDLKQLAHDDGVSLFGVNFYHSPLGVDSSVFFQFACPPYYLILTSGYVAKSESVDDVNRAVKLIGGRQCHLGPKLDLPYPDVVNFHHEISDTSLSSVYNSCAFVSGLRKVEGFELPAAEGLLCGARPLLFDRPHYRKWFGDFGVFIPEVEGSQLAIEIAHALGQYRPVTLEERKVAADLFSWPRIAAGFWSALGATPSMKSRPSSILPPSRPAKPRLLYVGDAGVSSGFAKAAERGILSEVHKHFDVTALGINYLGDPHDLPYPVYPCHDYYGGDAFGTYRLPKLVKKLKPEFLVIQQDPWNFPAYFQNLKEAKVEIPVIGSVAVDGLNCRGRAMRHLSHAAFWTEFGRNEAIKGGYEGPTSVIPLGIDTDIYKPMDKREARKLAGLTGKQAEGFIVGNVNRNQPRKRLDLTIAYFAEWVKTCNVPDAYLLLHVAPTGDQGYDVEQLMHYHGVHDRLILSVPDIGKGISERALNALYNTFDVQVSTTQGEGWGLTTMEGMACGVPQIVPDWSALGEWPENAVMKVPCIRETCVTPNSINSIGGVASSLSFIECLHRIYSDEVFRIQFGDIGLGHIKQPRFQWETIGKQWLELVTEFHRTLKNPVMVAV